MLRRTLAAFEKHPPKKVAVEKPVRNFPELPADVLVSHVYTRLSSPTLGAQVPSWKNPSKLNTRYGRDVMWMPQREVQALLRGEFPGSLQRRLLLGHLRDNVRGQPRLYRLEDVDEAVFSARASRTEREIRVQLRGKTRILAGPFVWEPSQLKLPASGFEAQLEGELVYDLQTMRVTRFILHAQCVAWGVFPLTPGEPKGKYSLEIGFEMADRQQKVPAQIPPHATGDDGHAMSYLNTGQCYR